MNLRFEKIHSHKGETLVETLISTLIIGISIMMLVTFIGSSVKINQQAKEREECFFGNLEEAEKQESYKDANGNLLMNKGEKAVLGEEKGMFPDVEIDIFVYGEEDGLISYKTK